MLLTPDQFDAHAPMDLLLAAEQGRIGFDQCLLASLDRRRELSIRDLEAFSAGLDTERVDERVVDLEEQCFDLWRHFRVPESAVFYVQLLAKHGEEMPDALVEACAELGAAAVEPLLAYLDSLEADDQVDVLFILAALGTRDDRIFARLVATLDQDPYEAAMCLGIYGDPAALPHIEAALKRLSSEQKDERRALVETMGTIGSGKAQPDFPLFDIYALYPKSALPVFPALEIPATLEYLKCEVPEWRGGAALSFADEDYPDEVRDALIESARGDADPGTRGYALRALAERSAEPGIKALLLAALEDEAGPWQVRAGAAVGLAFETADPRVHARLLEFYGHPERRATALQAMWRSLDERYAEYFPVNLDHENCEVRKQAVFGIGTYRLTAAAAGLLPLFEDGDLREDALFAYALAMPGKTSRKNVQKMLKEIDEEAGGLSADELESVEVALDQRLQSEGLKPFFHPEDHALEPEPDPAAEAPKPGRNAPCPCGSGKKYKKCCGV